MNNMTARDLPSPASSLKASGGESSPQRTEVRESEPASESAVVEDAGLSSKVTRSPHPYKTESPHVSILYADSYMRISRKVFNLAGDR